MKSAIRRSMRILANASLLSQMIHNPEVNADLQSRGVAFLHDTLGKELVPLTLRKDDVVIVPVFGTTLELERRSKPWRWMCRNTTPRVLSWRRFGSDPPNLEASPSPWSSMANQARRDPCDVFYAAETGHALVVKNAEETEFLASWMEGERRCRRFGSVLKAGRRGFRPPIAPAQGGCGEPNHDVGLDTQAIADRVKRAVDGDAKGSLPTPATPFATPPTTTKCHSWGAACRRCGCRLGRRRIQQQQHVTLGGIVRTTCPPSLATSWNGRRTACIILTCTQAK